MQSAACFVEHAGAILPCLVTKDPAHGFRLEAGEVGTGEEERHVREEDLHLPLFVTVLRQQRGGVWGVPDSVVHPGLRPVLEVVVGLPD